MDCASTGQNWRRLAFLLTNTGNKEVNMKNVTIDYKMTEPSADNLVSQTWFYKVRAANGAESGGEVGDVSAAFAKNSTDVSAIFSFRERVLQGGGSAEIQLGIHRSDWSNINENSDPSYVNSCTFADNLRVLVKYAGKCSSIDSPINGAVSYSDGTEVGSVATHTCNTGYVLNGSAARTCGANGSWSGAAPTCKAAKCRSLPLIANGKVTLSDGQAYGSVATYTCNEGFVLSGSGTLTCNADGNWSGIAPKCVPAR